MESEKSEVWKECESVHEGGKFVEKKFDFFWKNAKSEKVSSMKSLKNDPHALAVVAGADGGDGGSRGSVDQSRDATRGSHSHRGARWCGAQIAIETREMVQKFAQHEFIRRVCDVQLRKSGVFGQRRLHDFGIDSSTACGGRVRCRFRLRGMCEYANIVAPIDVPNEDVGKLSMLLGVHSTTTNQFLGNLIWMITNIYSLSSNVMFSLEG